MQHTTYGGAHIWGPSSSHCQSWSLRYHLCLVFRHWSTNKFWDKLTSLLYPPPTNEDVSLIRKRVKWAHHVLEGVGGIQVDVDVVEQTLRKWIFLHNSWLWGIPVLEEGSCYGCYGCLFGFLWRWQCSFLTVVWFLSAPWDSSSCTLVLETSWCAMVLALLKDWQVSSKSQSHSNS